MNRTSTVASAALAAAAGATGLWCAAALAGSAADPLRAPELVGALVIAAWAALAARAVIRDVRLRTILDRNASPMEADGIRCYVIRGGGRYAFVLGWLRPDIYVGSRLLADLQPEELLAVLRHEEHHRRTRAPMRAAALHAWATLLRFIDPVQDALADRLVDLEIEADKAAIDAGSSRVVVASALLKTEWLRMAGTSFTADPDRRIAWLVGSSPPGREDRRLRVPYEWLPFAMYLVVLAACHVGVAQFG